MKKIDILIPTYNRCFELERNLVMLDSLMTSENVESKFRVLVSDNSSTDATWGMLEKYKHDLSYEIRCFRQNENIGLEKNAIFLLKESTAEYIIYLGDDDYLSAGYLEFVTNRLAEDKIGVIFPGIVSVYPDGTETIARDGKYGWSKFESGYWSFLKLSSYGHQLSGLVLKRADLHQIYIAEPSKRNIYPFIFFASHSVIASGAIYAPAFKVKVTQGNLKDWSYDSSGLLSDVFKNYDICFANNRIKFSLACMAFLVQQPWRLRVSSNFKIVKAAYLSLMRVKYLRFEVKVFITLFYPILFVRKIGRRIGI